MPKPPKRQSAHHGYIGEDRGIYRTSIRVEPEVTDGLKHIYGMPRGFEW